jgi:hypothetical protein
MKIHVVILATGLLLAGFVGSALAQTNLVVNGSFEAGPAGENVFTDWGWVAGCDENSDFGVAKATGGFEEAEQGNYFAYFRGHPTDDSQDCLGTGVNLTSGAVYNISYYLGTDGPLTNGAAMWAQIGTDFGLDPSQDTQLPAFFPNSKNAIPYQLFSTNYVATVPSVILSFHGVNATNGLAVTNGILLDNVSMVLAYPHLKLNFTRPGSLTFAWQFTNSPYRLQASASLSAATWVTLTNTPSNSGANSLVNLAAPGGTQFYRLTLP